MTSATYIIAFGLRWAESSAEQWGWPEASAGAQHGWTDPQGRFVRPLMNFGRLADVPPGSIIYLGAGHERMPEFADTFMPVVEERGFRLVADGREGLPLRRGRAERRRAGKAAAVA